MKIDTEILKQVKKQNSKKNCLERFLSTNAQLILELVERHGIERTCVYLNRYLRRVKRKGDGLPFLVPRSELRKWVKKVKAQVKGITEGERMKQTISERVKIKA